MIQPPGGLFTRSGDPAPEYWVDDLANLRVFIEGFYGEHGLDAGITYLPLLRVEHNSEQVLSANVAIKTPSVFKRAAAFTLGFLQESPLQLPLGPDAFGPKLAKIGHIENHQNAILGFEYARACLVSATYLRAGEPVVLQKPICVSHHFYADLIFSLSTLPKKTMASASAFHEMALLYESLAYLANPDCSDPRVC
jgi:hypothetical protein